MSDPHDPSATPTELPYPGAGTDPYPPAKGLALALRAIAVFALLAIGVFIMRALIAAKPAAKREDKKSSATPVELVVARVTAEPQRVTATGTVVPARQVLVGAEVGGRVVWMSPELVPGGRFKSGQPLLRVDARDYKLALAQQNAQVTIARTELEVEKSRKRIAEKEWQLLGEKPPEAGSLALRDPQMLAAEGAVRAAESGLQRQQLAISKTGLTAPFNAMVLARAVDQGQLVGPGGVLATLVGTDAFWIQVSVPVDRLPIIAVPGMSGASQGSLALVRQRAGERVIERQGRVIRLAGDLDPVGRMARLIVEVADPLALAPANKGQAPLLLNSYVEVEITGSEVTEVVAIPRPALREGDVVWVAAGDELRIRKVVPQWRTRTGVMVRGELKDGERIIVSPLSSPAAGIKVREVKAGGGKADDGGSKTAAPPAGAGSGSAAPAPGGAAGGAGSGTPGAAAP